MSNVENLTIALTADIVAAMKSAVDAGDYASINEVARFALRDWAAKRERQIEELKARRAGPVEVYDAARIISEGGSY